MKIISFLLVSTILSTSYSQDQKIGYSVFSSQQGLSHFLYYGKSYTNIEFGIRAGYGVSEQFAKFSFTDSSSHSTGTLLSGYRNNAIKLEVPIQIGFPKWPHIIAQIGYEHILSLDAEISNKEKNGFSKFNDLFIYPGIGYELIIKKRASVYLNFLSRYILSDSNKLQFFDIKNTPNSGTRSQIIEINPTLGSKVFIQAGLNFLF